MNPRQTTLENLMDEFTIEQNQPLDCVTAPDIIISSSSHSSSSSTHSMSASSHGALVSLSLYSSSSLDMEQLKELIIRIRKVYKDYDVIHSTHHGQGKNVLHNPNNPNNPYNRLYVSTNLISSSAEDVANCFREVPDLFFRSDFSQQSPETFTATLGSRAQLLSGHWPLDASTSNNSTLKNGCDNDGVAGHRNRSSSKQQDNLSRYLDLVEVALLKHIWSRSPAFFRALDDIKGLQEQVQQASSLLRTLRIRLHALDEETAVAAMRIPQMFLRQKNESALSDKIASIQRVLQARSDIQCLLEVEDYLGALDEIAYAKQLFSKELLGLNCVKMIGQQLDSFDELVCEILCNRFVSLAVGWDEDSSSTTDREDTLDEKGANSDDDYSYLGGDGRERETGGSKGGDDAGTLEDLLIALLKCDHLPTALKSYKARLSEAIKLIVRTCVQEYLSTSFESSLLPPLNMDERGGGSDPYASYGADAAEDNTPFAQRVKEMGDDNFLSCLAMCFEHAILALSRSGRVDRLIESALKRSTVESTDAGLPSPSSSSSSPSLALAHTHTVSSTADAVAAAASTPASLIALSKSCLATACDLAQRSIAQLLALRRDATARISIEKMTFMWEISLHFVLTLEGLSGSTAYVIRQCLLTQTRAFLEHMHTTVKGKLVNTLDSERWAQCDVGADRQLELDRLSSGRLFMHKQQTSTEDGGVLKSVSGMNSSSGGGTGVRKKDCSPATVDGSPFKVVWSVMLLTEITLTYLDVSVSFPPVTTDVIAKIVELIKLFDHRTKQLVLGAQAIQSAARLKSISVKHLAVTAQSIGLLLALMPHIRAALLAQLPPKHHMQLLELDRVSNVLIDHHGRIVAKFVGIVGDFVDNSASRLRLVDWDSLKPSQGSTSTSSTSSSCEYFDEIQRNVTALHRVLLETLPAEQVQDVFSRIFALLNRRIPMHFEEIMPVSSGGKQRILDEVAHLVVAFLRLKQIDLVAAEATAVLEETFRKRYSNSMSNSMSSGGGSSGSNNNSHSNNNNSNNNINNNNNNNSSGSNSNNNNNKSSAESSQSSPLSVTRTHDNGTDRTLINTSDSPNPLEVEVQAGSTSATSTSTSTSTSQNKGGQSQQSLSTLIPSAT
jgi:vacuolar protein sorting-associated protein 54